MPIEAQTRILGSHSGAGVVAEAGLGARLGNGLDVPNSSHRLMSAVG